jgi:branched-subunit amino acid aminotransferase/4-amino-4-deoxychorismate lyase
MMSERIIGNAPDSSECLITCFGTNLLKRAEFNSVALSWDPAQQRFEASSLRDATLSPMDLGFLYGATVVERLRTFGGQLIEWESHWERFRHGCEVLGIAMPLGSESFDRALRQLLNANAEWISSETDVSLVVIATPGNPDFDLGSCTLMMHCLPIPWRRLAHWYRSGTSLVRSTYRTGAGASWPPTIKVRNRLAYYLADRDAEERSPGALGLVSTPQGDVGDTSVANLLMIDPNGNWISPTKETVLIGTTLQRSASLLAGHGITIHYRDIEWAELTSARELILVGNTGCVWHVADVDGEPIGDSAPCPESGPECKRLQDLWIKRIGFDWRSQPDSRASHVSL